jgi:hypothetical protein
MPNIANKDIVQVRVRFGVFVTFRPSKVLHHGARANLRAETESKLPIYRFSSWEKRPTDIQSDIISKKKSLLKKKQWRPPSKKRK